MFEDSLVESTSRIRTRARRYVAGSFFVEAALVALLILLPYFYPEALPRKFLTSRLLAPPPPAAAPTQRTAAAPIAHPEVLDAAIVAPSHIPRTWSRIVDSTPPGPGIAGLTDLGGARNGVLGLPELGTATPPPLFLPVPPGPPPPSASRKEWRPGSSSCRSSLSIRLSPGRRASRGRSWWTP